MAEHSIRNAIAAIVTTAPPLRAELEAAWVVVTAALASDEDPMVDAAMGIIKKALFGPAVPVTPR